MYKYSNIVPILGI